MATPRIKRFLSEVKSGVVPSTWWPHDECGQNAEAKAEVRSLLDETVDVFMTPKPERLLQRVIELSTDPGDLVLDSFAGSGTTGAVAHKMGRKWIMVEIGDHCDTHIVPRLQKVIDGDDPGGVTEATGWEGGGSFRYYTLAPSLMTRDDRGQWIINPALYDGPLLVQAIAKIEGFDYAPSDEVYWQQGQSSETDFLYVTTQTLTREQIEALNDEVGPDRSLVVFCKAFRVRKLEDFPNLTLKKIPKELLGKCEYDQDDYSLEVREPTVEEFDEDEPEQPPTNGRASNGKSDQAELFAETEAD